MVPLMVVVRAELLDRSSEMPFAIEMRRSRHSSSIDRTSRSAYALAFEA